MSRPPLVLLHGFGAASGHWRHNAGALAAAGWCVYAIDLLGFGDNSTTAAASAFRDICAIALEGSPLALGAPPPAGIFIWKATAHVVHHATDGELLGLRGESKPRSSALRDGRIAAGTREDEVDCWKQRGGF